MIVSVDFETRSPVDLKTCGAFVYFDDPDAKVLMAAYRIDDGPLKCWTYDQPPPLDLWEAIRAGATIRAFNAQFETLGFDMLARRHGWPQPRYDQYVDTAAAAAAMALPRALGDLGAALGLEVQKDKEGMRLIRKFSIPRKPKGVEPPGLYWHEPEDHPEDFARFVEYCKRDVETEEAAAKRLMPLSDYEQQIWLLDQKINRRGIRIDRASAQAALRLADKAKLQLDREMRLATAGYVPACSQPGKLVEWVEAQGVTMTSAAKAEITDLLEADDLPANVRKALEIRQEAAKTSVAKLQAMLNRASADGRVRGTFMYAGAGTGRWVNTGVNFANLPRPRKVFETAKEKGHLRTDALFRAIRTGEPDVLREFYGDDLGRPLHLVSDAIRGFLWAAPGKDLVQADYSNIEGNVVAWLAGEDWKLEAIRELNADPSLPDMYRRTAAAILGLTTEIVTKKHWARQAVGKPAELGLSYGGGVMAFVTFAQGYGVKLEPLAPAILAQADAERTERATKRYEACLKRKEHSTEVLSRDAWIACEIVKLGWRAANSAIAAYWGELENAARGAVQAPGTVVEAGKARYLVAKGFLWCQLPSGRCLAYGSPKLKDQVWAKRRIDGDLVEAEVMDRDLAEALERKGEARIEGPTKAKVTALGVNSVTKKWERFGLYGGLLCENCLSADTEVLTPYGWTRITDIRPTDMLWDGLAWVQHEGVVAKGSKMTIDFAGLRLTPDHRVWTNDGWKRAEDASVHEAYAASPLAGSDGTGFWPPDGRWLRGWRWSEGLVDRNVRVRHDEVVRRFGATERPHPELRMPAVGASERPTSDARAIPAQGLRSVEKHARPLRTDDPSRLSPLRRARDYGMRALAQLREFLGGHGADMEARPDAGAAGQQRGVLAGELRLGYSTGAGAQYSSEHSDRYASGPNVDLRGVRSFGRKRNDAMLSDRSGVADEDAVRAARHDAPRHVEPVFDIVNAGPLHRFTVRGEHGPVIVSNCTQATARDILVNGMLKAEAAGYEIIAHVYDEIITEVPRGFGDVAEFERLICELPDWAAGLPLMAGGFRAKRYKKD